MTHSKCIVSDKLPNVNDREYKLPMIENNILVYNRCIASAAIYAANTINAWLSLYAEIIIFQSILIQGPTI